MQRERFLTAQAVVELAGTVTLISFVAVCAMNFGNLIAYFFG